MDLKKKQKERQFLDAIINQFALSPDPICATEEPDFLLTT